MFYGAEVAVCSEINTKQIQCGQTVQGIINKRPDCCNKSFTMLIDTTYSSLSPSK